MTLPGPVRAVYEAGPTGFGLARAARAAGIEMMVCSPGAIPRQPGDHTKTDQRDAVKLARLHAAGQLRPVVVPEPAYEALGDLVRCREDLRGDLMACRHRMPSHIRLKRPRRTGRHPRPESQQATSPARHSHRCRLDNPTPISSLPARRPAARQDRRQPR
jgi:hypothetical protein